MDRRKFLTVAVVTATGSLIAKPIFTDDPRAVLARRNAVGAGVKVEKGRAFFEMTDGYRTAVAYIHSGAAHFDKMAKCGIHLQLTRSYRLPLGLKVDPDEVRQLILQVLEQDPQAYVVFHVSCNAPEPWQKEHPEEIWKNDGTPSKSKTKADNPSYGSDIYVDAVASTLSDLGRCLKKIEEGKVVVGLKYAGGNDGQFYGGWMSQLDHSEGHRRGYQKWLREQYKDNINNLRNAWSDNEATFENARVPLENERQIDTYLANSGHDRWIVDAQNFYNAVLPRMFKRWNQAFKEAIGKPVFVMAWGPDAIHNHSLNNYNVSERLEGKWKMDSQTGVNDYEGWRDVGEVGGGINLTWGSFLIRGCAPLCELDYRPPGVNLGPKTVEGFKAQIRRCVTAAASRGMCHWYYEMGGGTWYTEENILNILAEGVRIQQWAHRHDAPSPVAQMCALVDEDAGWRVGSDWTSIFQGHRASRKTLVYSGVPYDAFYLNDIRRNDMPDYKVYILLLGATISRDQVKAIQQKCHHSGKVLIVVTNRLGEGSPDYRGKKEELKSELESVNAKTIFDPVLPSFADLNRIARDAGIEAYATPGQVTLFGSGVAACHRITEGEIVLNFGLSVDLISTDGKETVLAENVTQWHPDCEKYETDLVFYRIRGI